MHDIDVFGAADPCRVARAAGGIAVGEAQRQVVDSGSGGVLVAAALTSDLFPSLNVSIKTVERVATVALIVVLLDGGASIGWQRFRKARSARSRRSASSERSRRPAQPPCSPIGCSGFDWTVAGLLGAAVAPTDPAVMFSVIGGHDLGRAGTVLEGESGANDPVGIALMIGLVELATHPAATFWIVVREFCVQMTVGLAVGVLGGLALRELTRRLSLPSPALYTLLTLAGAGIVYGAAAVGNGSGFLAVFVAGLVIADTEATAKSRSKSSRTRWHRLQRSSYS